MLGAESNERSKNLSNIPVIDGAKETFYSESSGSIYLEYQIKAKAEDVLNSYDEELLSLGWANENKVNYEYKYSKDNQKLKVRILNEGTFITVFKITYTDLTK